MKWFLRSRHCGGCVGFALMLAAANLAGAVPSLAKPVNLSLRNEVKRAIDKGLAWLEKDQNTNGFWSTADHPAITALALIAFEGAPEKAKNSTAPAAVKKGYDYLLSCAQPDGGIYRKDLPSYNTSVALTALCAANRSDLTSTILKARQFLIGLQNQPDNLDNPLAGGLGYGTKDKNPDLSNTSLALEALYYSKRFAEDKNLVEARDLNWKAAIHFIESCQNLSSHNPEKWVSDDPQNKGGFIYFPGNSKAGETNLPSGRIALRSYGTMSYAGLLSYIYADLRRDDPRVSAVMDWLRQNFTLDENPGMGPQGLFYYYHTMAKALTLYDANTIETKEGKQVNWREQLALKLIDLQRTDGSWANASGRWFEKDPDLVTAYGLIALDLIYRGL